MNIIKAEIKNVKLESKHDPNQLPYYSDKGIRTVYSLQTSGSLSALLCANNTVFNHYKWTVYYKNTPDIWLINTIDKNFQITGFAYSGSFFSNEFQYDYIAFVSGSNSGYHYSGLWMQEEVDRNISRILSEIK